jgi:hypothetical protein
MEGLFIFHPVQKDDPLRVPAGQSKVSVPHPTMKIESFSLEAIFFDHVALHPFQGPF